MMDEREVRARECTCGCEYVDVCVAVTFAVSFADTPRFAVWKRTHVH